MCATIPMFRVRASGYSRSTRSLRDPPGWRPLTSCAASTTSILSAEVAISPPPPPAPGSRARHERFLRSPSVMRERLVRLGHLVHVLAPLDGGPLALGGVHDLPYQSVGHGMLLTGAGVIHQPAQRERGASGGPNLHRHLLVRPADPPRPDLEHRTDVLHRPLQRDDRVVRRPLRDDLERLVHGP